MSEMVEVPFEKGEKVGDQAVLLLAAAEQLGLPASVIQVSNGAFLAPPHVKDKAFAKSEPKTPTTKKVAAKSTTPKKAQE